MICYFHEDLDGICSAAIIKHKYPWVELIPLNYGDDYDEKIFSRNFKNETIFFVDITTQPVSIMSELTILNRVIILDHHITAINNIKALNWEPEGILDTSKAGCELAWQYCFPYQELPLPVYYLGRYDVWDHSNELTLPFQYGMRLLNLAPDSHYWKYLFAGHKDSYALIIEDGELVIEWEKTQNAKRAANAFEAEFEGLRAIVCNGDSGSPLFDSVYNEDKHDIMVSFIYTKNKVWTYGLYSTKPDVNCGEIAKRRGGGGHFSASGFQSKKFLF
ncbi:MAG: DHH family phosphoesterase [Candidatus Shapirobacteria bacterium]